MEGPSCNVSITVAHSTGGGDDLGGGSIAGIVFGLLISIAVVIAIIIVGWLRRATSRSGTYSLNELTTIHHQSEQEPPERLI
jgi:uncharacterized membrane protein